MSKTSFNRNVLERMNQSFIRTIGACQQQQYRLPIFHLQGQTRKSQKQANGRTASAIAFLTQSMHDCFSPVKYLIAFSSWASVSYEKSCGTRLFSSSLSATRARFRRAPSPTLLSQEVKDHFIQALEAKLLLFLAHVELFASTDAFIPRDGSWARLIRSVYADNKGTRPVV